MWDLVVCPITGSLLTVGADGQLNLSLTGRLLPACKQRQFNFGGIRTLLSLKKKRKDVNSQVAL